MKSNKTYPEILIPSTINEFFEDSKLIIAKWLSPKETSKPEKPKNPKKPEEPQNFNLTFFIVPVFFTVVVYFISDNLLYTCLTYLFILAFIIYNHLDNKSSYKNELIKYNNDLVEYEKSIKNYDSELKHFEKEIIQRDKFIGDLKEKLNESSFLNKLKNEYQKKELFKNTLVDKKDIENFKIGRSEKVFLEYLNTYFGDKILINKSVGNFLYQYDEKFEIYHYNPDFIFFDNRTNLHIDIEIDEPYTFEKPIHYYLNEEDKKRNDFFLKNNWIIIRFSEEQILNNPESCCKELALLINQLISDDSYINSLSLFENLYKHRKWTKSEVCVLQNNNYRFTKGARIENILEN